MKKRPRNHDKLPANNIAFWVYNVASKTFFYANSGIEDMFGKEVKRINSVRVFISLVHPADKAEVISHLRGSGKMSHSELDYRIVNASGEIKLVKNLSLSINTDMNGAKTVFGCTYHALGKKTVKVLPFVRPETIIKAMPGSYLVIDNNCKILDANIKPGENAILKSDSVLCGKSITGVLHSEISLKIKEQLLLFSAKEKELITQLQLILKNETTWFDIRMVKPQEEIVLVNIRNITEHAGKINSVKKFYNLTEQSHELIIITNVEGTIEYANPMVTKVTGYSLHELVGKNAAIFRSGKHDPAFYLDLWNTILKGKAYKAEFQNLKKDGEIFLEKKVITPLSNMEGKITNFISTGRDITRERKDELKAIKYKQLQVTIEEKEQKSQTLSLIKSNEIERKKFAHSIHEGLSQMLLAAMANIESLSSKNVITEDEKNKIEFINQMVSEIIQELRGISSDLSPISLYKFGLFPVLKQMVANATRLNKDLNIEFTSNIAEMRFKSEVEINIYRIIHEAIQNIMKHANARKIVLSLNFLNNNLILNIRDNGKGINMNTLEFKKMSTFGILNIEARAKSIGARLNIISRIDNGFAIDLSLNTKTTQS